jgi:hypothetical protein
MASLSRWVKGEQQMESARLVLLAEEALKREGVSNPRAHLAFVSSSWVGTLLVSKEPFVGSLLDRLDRTSLIRGFLIHWPTRSRAPVRSLVTQVLTDGPQDLETRGFQLEPPTDERPFFFQTARLFRWRGAELGFNEHSVSILRILLLILTALAAALFFLPFVLSGKLERHERFWSGSSYFACIGLGFMLVELPWIQKTILYLGHPSYAAATVIGSMLLGAGLGSMSAARFETAKVAKYALLLPCTLAVINLMLTPVFSSTIGYPFGVRVLSCAAMMLPAGWLMGFAFPTGMLYFGDGNKAWFWAMNGSFSVLASALSLALAMELGFVAVGFSGVGFYLAAVVLLLTLRRPSASIPGAR